MSQILIALSTWLHALATIVMIGYFIFTSLIYLPVFERQIQVNALRPLLEQISARLKPFFWRLSTHLHSYWNAPYVDQ